MKSGVAFWRALRDVCEIHPCWAHLNGQALKEHDLPRPISTEYKSVFDINRGPEDNQQQQQVSGWQSQIRQVDSTVDCRCVCCLCAVAPSLLNNFITLQTGFCGTSIAPALRVGSSRSCSVVACHKLEKALMLLSSIDECLCVLCLLAVCLATGHRQDVRQQRQCSRDHQAPC